MTNRSITKAMLGVRPLGQCFSTRGREIKLQYTFTNIMTRMLSNVKKYILFLRRRNTVLMALCEYRLNGGSKPLYEQTTALAG